MKTCLKIILLVSIISITLAGVVIAAFALPRSLAPEQEERISYDKDQQVALIDSQLAGIDLEKVRAKKDLIMEKSIEDLLASRAWASSIVFGLIAATALMPFSPASYVLMRSR